MNVNTLIELVQENKIIQAEMRASLRQRIVQDIVSIVVGSDRDNSQTIDDREAKLMTLKINMALQEYDVMFDQEKFLKAVGGDTALHAIIEIVKKLLPSTKKNEEDDTDSESDSDDEDDVYDMFHMAKDHKRMTMAGGKVADGVGESGGVSLITCDKRKRSSDLRHTFRREKGVTRLGLPRGKGTLT
mmetsp:Transcript_25252/g.53766  ORF Transcript_25252/g.53766 Transcript_25252/m.53766 type:complete len:187 (-) Transcript_25252:90-650(-)